MRTLSGTAQLQSAPDSAHGVQLSVWRHHVTHRTPFHKPKRACQGRSRAANSDMASAATVTAASSAAAARPDPGLESFKALIGERRFHCTQCGKCCTGAGEVWVSDAEAANIARYLNLPLARFLALHCHAYSKVEGFRLLRSNMESETRDCTFLRPDNTCAIHPVRPLQCSTYPWWPELMDEKEWQQEKADILELWPQL
ncbi:hypothetical protein OEZ85_007631 [Tetradesmus obliquus]|uniref:YkgJ family cysteine cluster protein n=1 Tax=Tetradesmus obliquus TaxID=3088 RepID=A0ABY8TI92_TETOB|nr:hypothetical protein OEZ85_007631 [Tetradesmus obliquus]